MGQVMLVARRKIKIVPVNLETIGKRVKDALCEKNGITEVRIDEQKMVISVKYDLLRVNFTEIEKWLESSDISFSKGLFERWKRGWAKFTEQNELDNFSEKPTSCCDDPKSSSASCGKR
ncbi:MAG: hypothetical protein KKB53_09220 [Acidobacteria bacterium]|nr:hypothetical protein [Acidobacteriota bacterium]